MRKRVTRSENNRELGARGASGPAAASGLRQPGNQRSNVFDGVARVKVQKGLRTGAKKENTVVVF